MPIRSDCPHCNDKNSVFPVNDDAHKREIYICASCYWWGTERDKIAYPLPETAKLRATFETTGRKCLLCGSENIYMTSDDDYPFACNECNAWGNTPDDISNPDETVTDFRHGQVPKRPRS